MSIQEGRAAGVQWSNLFKRSDPADPLTMGAIWGMFLADMIIYGFITWYIDAVKPGKYGVAKKWYFLIQVSPPRTPESLISLPCSCSRCAIKNLFVTSYFSYPFS